MPTDDDNERIRELAMRYTSEELQAHMRAIDGAFNGSASVDEPVGDDGLTAAERRVVLSTPGCTAEKFLLVKRALGAKDYR